MIYGVQYSTDSRDDGRETFERFRTEPTARDWVNEIGPRGVGPSFGPENGHRYIRQIYRVQDGLPRSRRLTWGAIRAAGERIDP